MIHHIVLILHSSEQLGKKTVIMTCTLKSKLGDDEKTWLVVVDGLKFVSLAPF